MMLIWNVRTEYVTFDSSKINIYKICQSQQFKQKQQILLLHKLYNFLITESCGGESSEDKYH